MEKIVFQDVPDVLARPGSGAEKAATQSPVSAVRVWLVDDSDELRETLADVLEKDGGIKCVRHFSSPEALLSTLASKPGPDVILLDVQMGRHCGLDAVRPIKSLTRSTRVLMFTSCFNMSMRERAFGDGASDYLLKSQSLEYVAARIRNPAGDPPPRPVARRRASCPPETARSSERAASLARHLSRLVHRTLRAMRLL